MKKLVHDIINRLALSKITFGDVRFTSTDRESYYFEKGSLKEYANERDVNTLGIRVLIDGCWGFAGINDFTTMGIDKAIKRAIDNATDGARFMREKVSFPAVEPTMASYLYNPAKNPFVMQQDEKLSYLLNIAKKLTGHEKIVFDYLYTEFYRQYKVYANTEGTYTDSLNYQVLPFMGVIAGDDNGIQRRTYPGDMSARVGGFEILEGFKFEENIDNIVKEAVDLLTAPTITEERADIIIGRDLLALQLHESVGHATEADRIFGMEISYAGKTYIKPDMIGSFQYGSDKVNIISDSTDVRGMGYHPVDDEGIPGKRVDIIKGGKLVGQQTARDFAHKLGLEPSSNMKASHGYDYPLVRMSNFSLLPGDDGSLDDLIANTERGYYIDFVKSWSIDDNRNNFQFTAEIGRRIEDGKLTGLVKEPTYYGITPEFWNSCDAICSKDEWEIMGTFFCGKGEPGQVMHLSHGVAPARFRDVVVNVKA